MKLTLTVGDVIIDETIEYNAIKTLKDLSSRIEEMLVYYNSLVNPIGKRQKEVRDRVARGESVYMVLQDITQKEWICSEKLFNKLEIKLTK